MLELTSEPTLSIVERSVNEILENFVFKLHCSDTYDEIKYRVSEYLSTWQEKFLGYNVIMDATNNPPNVVYSNTAILDIEVRVNPCDPEFWDREVYSPVMSNRVTIVPNATILFEGISWKKRI